MSTRIFGKRALSVLITVVLVMGLVVPFTASAEAPFTADTVIMASDAAPDTYTTGGGDKDMAFASDGEKLILSFEVTDVMDLSTHTQTSSFEPLVGYSNETVKNWIYAKTNDNLVVKINGVELDPDSAMTGEKYFNVTKTRTSTNVDNIYTDVTTYTLTIKPGVEITDNFFTDNKVEISVLKATTDPVIIGNYTGEIPPATLKPAKVMTPADSYRTKDNTDSDAHLILRITGDLDQRWVNSITSVTYAYGDNAPQNLTMGKASISNNKVNFTSGTVAVFNDTSLGFVATIKNSVFSDMAANTTRSYTFTFKADGYEDTVVTQTVLKPEFVLMVTDVNKQTKYYFTADDLNNIWVSEGSKSYTYSSYSTVPAYETTTVSGPTVDAVLASVNFGINTLSDNCVIKFCSNLNGKGGNTSRISVKDLKETRYYYPNGETTNSFNGTAESQLTDKVEVPYIVSLYDAETKVSNYFGQRDPQEQQKNDWMQGIQSIVVCNKDKSSNGNYIAVDYTGLTPTVASGTEVAAGTKLNFNLDTSNAGFGTSKYVGVYYTISTDGTEPADPTMSDILYNYKQDGTINYTDNPEDFNSYTFTNADTTIIKVMAYARGFKDPVVTTLTYRFAHTWDDGVVTTEPTCTTEGVKTYTCTNPNCAACIALGSAATKTEVIPALGHDFGAWQPYNETQHQRICANDPAHIEYADHVWSEGACAVCGVVDIANATIAAIPDQDYTGNAVEPTLSVTYGDNTLVLGTDYTVEYANNILCGNEATATITGIGAYTKTKEAVTFTIKMSDDANAEIDDLRDASIATVAQIDNLVDPDKYTPGSYAAYKAAYDAFKNLMLSEDINQDTLKEIRAARSAVTRAYLQLELRTNIKDEGAVVTLATTSYTYDGKVKSPAVTVTLGDVTLVKDTDYTVAYKNNTAAGTATVTITGINDYVGSVSKTFTIAKASIKSATVTLPKTSYAYTGKAQSPAPTVKVGSTTLKNGTDYTVSYKNNKNAGTATVTITGKGNYSGSVSKTFKITKIANPMTAKAAKSSFSFSLSKVKSAAQTVAAPVTVSKAQGTVTYKKTSGNSNITIDSKTGKLTVKKGTKKGTYTIKVQVKAAGNTNYNAKTTTVSFKVIVK